MGVARPPHVASHLTIHTLCNGSYKENCYLIEHNSTRKCVIIDPGSEFEFLEESISTLNLTVTHILLTHGHFDHLGAVDALMKKFGVTCEAHAFEKKLVRQASTYAYRFARQRLLPPMQLSYFDECSDISWSGGTIRPMHTPGHTSGSVSYAFDDLAVFTGDTLFHSYIGPSNYPESDPAGLLVSIALIMNSLPIECLIFPGHSKPWTIREARLWWQNVANSPPQFQLFGDKKP